MISIVTEKEESHIIATVKLPDAAIQAWDGSSRGSAIDGSRGAKCFLGFHMRIVKSGLQKSIRNGQWPLAAIMVAEAFGNLKIFEKDGKPTKNSKAIATNVVNRLLTIAVEDCAGSPGLVNLALQQLLNILKRKGQYDYSTMTKLVRIAVALCGCQHFRPSPMLHSYATANAELTKQMGVNLGPEPKNKSFGELLKEKNPYAFRMLADGVTSKKFISEFWALLGKKFPLVHDAHKDREKAMDHRAFLQYALMQEIYGNKLDQTKLTELPLPAEYLERETEILAALIEKRYSCDIPADSIIRDLHTKIRTAQGAEFFRKHASVVNCPEAFKELEEKFIPVYYATLYK